MFRKTKGLWLLLGVLGLLVLMLSLPRGSTPTQARRGEEGRFPTAVYKDPPRGPSHAHCAQHHAARSRHAPDALSHNCGRPGVARLSSRQSHQLLAQGEISVRPPLDQLGDALGPFP